MDSRTLIKMVEAAGWKLDRIRGSHHTFTKPGEVKVLTIKHPQKDIPPGTLNKTLKDAGLK